MKKLNIAVIGFGPRGWAHVHILLTKPEEAEICSVCDLYPDRAELAASEVVKAGFKKPEVYTDYKMLLDAGKNHLDAVVISCNWEEHMPVARAALKAGIAVGLEVGGAFSIYECFELVRLSEDTGVPVMLLENCCYDRHEMAVLNMVRQGALGEIVHCGCGYLHDLRDEICRGKEERHYRLEHFLYRNAENYPTHGIGPIAKYLNINRGNRFLSLTSMSSKSCGLAAWTAQHLPPDHPLQNRKFNQGDVITTMIKCANGETILCTLCDSLPRPYSRGGLVQGTKGIWMEEGYKLHLEDRAPKHSTDANDLSTDGEWMGQEDYLKEFEHPLWIAENQKSERTQGHGGMDYLVLEAFLDSLRRGVQPPIDVYDAAAWMAVTALSEESISLGSQPVAFPDFTEGKWVKREPVSEGPYAL